MPSERWFELINRKVCVSRNAWEGEVDAPKGGRIRYVPLTTRLTAALHQARHLRGPRVLYRDVDTPFTEAAVTWAIVRAARRAGLAGNGPHRLRHYAGSRTMPSERWFDFGMGPKLHLETGSATRDRSA